MTAAPQTAGALFALGDLESHPGAAATKIAEKMCISRQAWIFDVPRFLRRRMSNDESAAFDKAVAAGIPTAIGFAVLDCLLPLVR